MSSLDKTNISCTKVLSAFLTWHAAAVFAVGNRRISTSHLSSDSAAPQRKKTEDQRKNKQSSKIKITKKKNQSVHSFLLLLPIWHLLFLRTWGEDCSGRERKRRREGGERGKVCTPLLWRERVCVHSMKGSRSKGARINLIGAVLKLEKGRLLGRIGGLSVYSKVQKSSNQKLRTYLHGVEAPVIKWSIFFWTACVILTWPQLTAGSNLESSRPSSGVNALIVTWCHDSMDQNLWGVFSATY